MFGEAGNQEFATVRVKQGVIDGGAPKVDAGNDPTHITNAIKWRLLDGENVYVKPPEDSAPPAVRY